MTGILRAIHGEVYAVLHRRSTWVSVLLVVLACALHALFSWLRYGAIEAGATELEADAIARRTNFWPRFASNLTTGLLVAQMCVLVVISAGIPREIGQGVARDPLVRRISRPAFLSARAFAALLLPVLFGAVALGSAHLFTGALFEAGHITTKPIHVQRPDDFEESRAIYEAFLAEHDLRPGDLSVWRDRTDDGEERVEEVREELGLPAIEYPEWEWPGWDFVPLLLSSEQQVSEGIREGLGHAVPPLIALSLYALLWAVLVPTGAFAAMATLGTVLVGSMLLPLAGDVAQAVFIDWLPALGPDNLLAVAAHVAEGFTDQPLPEEDALAAGTWSSWVSSALFLTLSYLVFQVRRI